MTTGDTAPWISAGRCHAPTARRSRRKRPATCSSRLSTPPCPAWTGGRRGLRARRRPCWPGVGFAWAVAAGWAIDLHLGRQTREHSDLEIAIPRARFGVYRRHLKDFDLYVAGGGRVRRLAPDSEPDPEAHQIWVCEAAVPAWRLDTFLEPGDESMWIHHRDPRISVPMRDAVLRTADGIPYLRPEIVLFTKAKHAREKDEADLALTLPTLDRQARAWLTDAIGLVHPGHRWLDRIETD